MKSSYNQRFLFADPSALQSASRATRFRAKRRKKEMIFSDASEASSMDNNQEDPSATSDTTDSDDDIDGYMMASMDSDMDLDLLSSECEVCMYISIDTRYPPRFK